MSRKKPPAQFRRRAIAPANAAARGKKRALRLDTESTDLPSPATHPIVGIGASAGGLEAFQQVLKALPSDTGMAFVLVQHLDPKHESMLTKLLAKSTPMPVSEVREGVSVEPNHIYVIPPNANMGILNGVLHLTARPETGSWHMPIDHFLQSLAEAHGNRAIGVILSGAASDGTIGLKAIKAEGGITFAQSENSAKYDSMPHNAIASGCVDFVLPPAGIARELARLGRHPYVGLSPAEAASLPAEDNQDLAKVFRLLRSATGVDFTHYKLNTIKRRVARRMALQKISNLRRYGAFLQENRQEMEALYEDFLIHVTGFFREPETFRQLKKAILPKILHNKRPGESIRVWVPGCSTGEEVYSYAMMLLEYLGDRASSVPVQIFGTDISQPAIDKARSGIYTQSAVAGVTPERLRRFFEKVEGGYSVRKPVREMCVFARQDLAKDPPFSRIDLLSCRNVLIYMGPVLQKKVMTILHYAVNPKGFLILGKSESISGFSDLFLPVGNRHKVYAKKSLDHRLAFEMPAAGSPPDAEGAGKQGAPAPPRFDVQKEADRLVVNHYAPPGLIANEHLQIVHFRGDASPFLAPSAGEASLGLLKMVRSELAVELSAAIHRARKLGAPVRKDGILLKRNGNLQSVGFRVIPIEGDSGERYVLVLFDETAVADPAAETPALAKAKDSKSHDAEIGRLGRELQDAKEYLRSVIEDQEASQEELKAANEEVLSSNEELQSNNEELETAKEELQSTNEELVTINEQLQNTNVELAQLNDDLANLLGGVNIPIVMLGSDLRIRRFTPLAERLLNLHPGDMGRSIDNLKPNLNVAHLEGRLREVIETVTVQEQEVQDHEGRWWALRLRPYKTTDNRIEGVVMIFIDINALKVTQAALSEQSAFGSAILESAGALVMVTDPEGRIVRFNHACQQSSGYTFEEVKGKCVWNGLLIPEADVEAAKAVYRKVLGGSLAVQHENHWITRSSERRLLVWNTTLLPNRQGAARHLVLVGRDITEQRLAESALEAADLALRTSQAQLEKLAAGLLAAQEEERRRVSRELHDDVIQKLVSLTVEVETLIRRPPESDVSQSKLRTLRDRISGISDDIRRTAQVLHPASLEHLGLAPVLKPYCADFGRREGIRVKFSERELPGKVPAEISLSLFRVVQEALRNVAKHSGARAATVSLAGRDGGLHLAVRDTGRGFDPQRIRMKGLGLISMDERVRLVSGQFLLQAKPGEGTRIDIRVPLARKRDKPGGALPKVSRMERK